MIKENGIVTQADPAFAWVKTTRSAACEGCSSRESCGTGHPGKDMIVKVKNTLAVEKGDGVVIGLETKPMLMLSFLLYVFPILLLVLGAAIGDSLAPLFNINKSLAAMALGFLSFFTAFLVIRKKQSDLAVKDEFHPFLVKKRPAPLSGNCQIQ